MNYAELTTSLKKVIGLKREPVGIKFFKENISLDGYDTTSRYTFCQFLMKAAEGEKHLIGNNSVACANGASALGFNPVPEKILNGEFLANLGTFTKEGAAKAMQEMPRFSPNLYAMIAVAPLAEATFAPDIIVIEAKPEHLMWLTLACLHKEGGRLNFSTSISNGTCVDVSIVPHLTQKLNVSLGCYGCRNATSITDEFLLAGFPGAQLEMVVEALIALQEKAMPRTRSKKAYNRLIKGSGRSGA